MEQNNQNIIELILGLKNDTVRKSTLQLALKQARRIAGFSEGKDVSRQSWNRRGYDRASTKDQIVDIAFGNARDEAMDILTSLCLYLIVLDQLGHVFRKSNRGCNKVGEAITQSEMDKKYHLDAKDVKSIKELRNSINHNFGLASCKCSSKKDKEKEKVVGKEKFIICFDNDENHKPVERGGDAWDGNWEDENNKKSAKTSTLVYPFSLMNLAEDVLKSFIYKVRNGTISSPLSNGELKSRFTIIDGSN